MTNMELVLNMLAEVAATDISIVRQPVGLKESAEVAVEGAKAAKVAREQIEQSTGKSAISYNPIPYRVGKSDLGSNVDWESKLKL